VSDDGGQKKPERGRSAIPIPLTQRWIAGVLGVACLGAGATATFIRSVEAGPVALVAGGVLLVLVALAGYMPRRLKWGDNEAEFSIDELREYAAERIDEAPPQEQDRLVERLMEVDPPAAVSAQRARSWERTAMAMLDDVISVRHDVIATDVAVSNDTIAARFDAVIARADGTRKAVVQANVVRSMMTPDWVDMLHAELVAAVHPLEVQMMLLILNEPPPLVTQKRLLDFADIHVAIVRGRQDTPVLQVAVDRVIGPFDWQRFGD
jgi:hypothetical protein